MSGSPAFISFLWRWGGSWKIWWENWERIRRELCSCWRSAPRGHSTLLLRPWKTCGGSRLSCRYLGLFPQSGIRAWPALKKKARLKSEGDWFWESVYAEFSYNPIYIKIDALDLHWMVWWPLATWDYLNKIKFSSSVSPATFRKFSSHLGLVAAMAAGSSFSVLLSHFKWAMICIQFEP